MNSACNNSYVLTNCLVIQCQVPKSILLKHSSEHGMDQCYIRCDNSDKYTRVGTLIVATIYLQLIQNRYKFRSFTILHSSHQHCLQPVANDVEVVGYL